MNENLRLNVELSLVSYSSPIINTYNLNTYIGYLENKNGAMILCRA